MNTGFTLYPSIFSHDIDLQSTVFKDTASFCLFVFRCFDMPSLEGRDGGCSLLWKWTNVTLPVLIGCSGQSRTGSLGTATFVQTGLLQRSPDLVWSPCTGQSCRFINMHMHIREQSCISEQRWSFDDPAGLKRGACGTIWTSTLEYPFTAVFNKACPDLLALKRLMFRSVGAIFS